MKKAILNIADTGPLESLVIMLRSVGYECFIPNKSLRSGLRSLGLDLVLDIDDLVNGMGYERPMTLPEAGLAQCDTADLFVDVKAHRNYSKIVGGFPSLASKVLWYRINGGQPEHVIKSDGTDCGDEANPPCPILTPNLWYKYEWEGEDKKVGQTTLTEVSPVPWKGRAYSCYPPFYRFDEYYPINKRVPSTAPICLVHNLRGWGYGALIDNMRSLGVKCYGDGSPDGLVPHSQIPQMLSTALCMVHLKSSDAPGYALYEALAAACPIVCTRRLIWRNRMQDLLIPGNTCWTFDRETHDGLSKEDISQCTAEVEHHLDHLKSFPENAHELGMAGRERLKSLMWSENKPEDVASLADFFERNF